MHPEPQTYAEFREGKPSPALSRHSKVIKCQCMVVVFLLTADLALAWLRPVVLFYGGQYSSVTEEYLSNETRDRDVQQRLFDRLIHFQRKLMFLTNIASALNGARFISFLPFLVTVFLILTRDDALVRSLSLLAIIFPLALGVYQKELMENSIWLIWSGTMVYQYIVVSLTAYGLARADVHNWRKPMIMLGCVPPALFVTKVIEGNTSSLWVIFSLTIFTTQLLLWGVLEYCKLCLRGAQPCSS